MKFGKRLQREASRQWEGFYINYKALKAALRADAEGTDYSAPLFWRLLCVELVRVDAFFLERERELRARLSATDPSRASAASLHARARDMWKFAVLNRMAVTKAVKKRNRLMLTAWSAQPGFPAGEAPPSLDAAAILARSAFGSSRDLARLVTHAELAEAQGRSEGEGSGGTLLDRENYSCPVCLDLLRAPVILPCSHRFCWGCVVGHAQSHRLRRAEESPQEAPPPAKGSSLVLGLSWPGRRAAATPADAVPCPVCRVPTRLEEEALVVDARLEAFVRALERRAVEAGTEDDSAAEAPFAFGEDERVDGQGEAGEGGMQENGIVLKPSSLVFAFDAEEEDDGANPRSSPPSSSLSSPVAPLLPPPTADSSGRLTVCLDLDGTLVSTFSPRRAPPLSPELASYVVARDSELNPGGVLVVERPGLGALFACLRRLGAETVLFTAGLPAYAGPIADALESRYPGAFAGRLFRAATRPGARYPCVKDLRVLGRALGRCVLVDDTPLAFDAQPDNALPVLPFRDDPDDRLLEEAVVPQLEGLAAAAEGGVQAVLGPRFGMRRWLRAQAEAGVARERAGSLPAARERAVPTPAAKERLRLAAPAPPAADPPAPRSSLSNIPPPPRVRTLAVFDFDKTLLDADAGEALLGEVAPELAPVLARHPSAASFVEVTNGLLAEAARRGSGRAEVEAALARVAARDFPAAASALLRGLRRAGDALVVVLSDCNEVVIDRLLRAAGVRECVHRVVTNYSAFEEVERGAPSPSWAGAVAPAGERLVVRARHAAHGCALCPSNLCKGRELDALRAEFPAARVVYAGDGPNDLCPALRLGDADLLLPRRAFALDRLLQARAADGERLRPGVRAWGSQRDLHRCVLPEEGGGGEGGVDATADAAVFRSAPVQALAPVPDPAAVWVRAAAA